MRLVGSLAQLVEQLAFNQLVAGSNPARPTTSFYDLERRVKIVRLHSWLVFWVSGGGCGCARLTKVEGL